MRQGLLSFIENATDTTNKEVKVVAFCFVEFKIVRFTFCFVAGALDQCSRWPCLRHIRIS